MLNATIAPDFTGTGTVLLQVTKTHAAERGKMYTPGAKFPVIIIESPGKPTMVIAEDGTARLVRKQAKQSFGERHVYASKKAWHIDNPFRQKMSALIDMYEVALSE
jgi:hypothetical protein